MHTNTHKKYPVVLTIAGSDSGGGAGIQADLKTFSALGTFGTSAITALTAQNTLGVRNIYPVSASFVQEQIEAVVEDLQPTAVKIGMLHTVEVVEVVSRCIKKYNLKQVVLDPVMVATSGDFLIKTDTIAAIVEQLFPVSTIITPNLNEAEALLSRKIDSLEKMQQAAQDLIKLGCHTALLKGGHLIGKQIFDIFQEADKQEILQADFVDTKNTHGTGCTLSSAIAAFLSKGYTLHEAVVGAKQYIVNALEAGKDIEIGKGSGPVNHFFDPLELKSLN